MSEYGIVAQNSHIFKGGDAPVPPNYLKILGVSNPWNDDNNLDLIKNQRLVCSKLVAEKR